MATVDELLIKIDASTELLRRELQKGSRDISGFERGTVKSLNKMDQRFESFGRTIKTALAALGVGIGIRGLTNFANSVKAAGIEMQRMERTFRAATGSAVVGSREFEFVRQEADRLGLSLSAAADQYGKLIAAAKGTALEGQASRDIFSAISEASRVLGLSVEQTGGSLTAIEQIISKGTVSAEELRGQLGERLPGAFQIAARSIGVTTQELDKMLRQGQLTAEELLPKLAQELRSTFGSEVENAANDAQAAFNRLATSIFELKAAIAESGVIDALAAAAKFASAATIGLSAGFFNTDPFAFGKEIADIEDRMLMIRDIIENSRMADNTFGMSADELRDYRLELVELQENLDYYIEQQRIALGLTREMGGATGALTTTVEKVNDVIAPGQRRSPGASTGVVRRSAVGAGIFLPSGNRATSEQLDFVRQQFEQMSEEIAAINERTTEKLEDRWHDFGETVGFTVRSSMADALLGIEQDWGQTIRRMIADWLVQKALLTIGSGIPGPIGAFVSGIAGRAEGGPVHAGTPYLVGEKRPEVFVPNVSGTIMPTAGGSVVVNQSIHFDVGLESVDQRIYSAAPLIARATEAKINESRSRGR